MYNRMVPKGELLNLTLPFIDIDLKVKMQFIYGN